MGKWIGARAVGIWTPCSCSAWPLSPRGVFKRPARIRQMRRCCCQQENRGLFPKNRLTGWKGTGLGVEERTWYTGQMNSGLSPSVINRVARELRGLQTKPEEGIKVIFNEDNLSEAQAEYDGPVGTPYEGGLFRMKLVLGADFPKAPPKGYFLTKIFHPNVSKAGEICVNVLKRDWRPDMGLRHVLVIVRCLLIEPFPESALNEEAGKLLLEDYADFAKHARLMTSIHAQSSKRAMPLTAAGGANAVNSQDESSVEREREASPEGGAVPAVKKPKGAEKDGRSRAAAAKKKALRRL